jgi:hypothetical protein
VDVLGFLFGFVLARLLLRIFSTSSAAIASCLREKRRSANGTKTPMILDVGLAAQ